MKGKLSAALLLVLCAGWPGGAASGQALRWDVEVGFDGAFKEGAWMPVYVNAENTGESQTGEIVIPVIHRTGAAERTVIYSTEVDLPRNSKKRYLAYVPAATADVISLRLDPSGARELRDFPAGREAGRDDALVVVVGGDRGLLSFLTGVQIADRFALDDPFEASYYSGTTAPGRQGEILVGHTTWDKLPDSWLGWDGVDAVVLGDAGFAAAPQEGLEALQLWLEQGGTLVVPGGSLSPDMASGPIAHILPLDFAGTVTVPDLEAVGAWIDHPIPHQPVLVAGGTLREGVEVLCGTAARPLVAARRVGSGRVVMTAFDFGAAPVKYWDGQTQLWPRLLAEMSPRPSLTADVEGRTAGHRHLITLADGASYTRAGRLPAMWFLVGFLAAYILALVPGNYFLLRRLNRRGMGWVTTPAIIVVFTVAAYGAGHGLRGGEVILNRLAVLEAAPGATLARGRGYVGLFSPGRAVYDLLLEGSAAGVRDVTPGEQHVRGVAAVHHGAEPRITGLAMNMWTSRALCVEFVVDLGRGIDAVAEWDGSDLRVIVRNDSDLRLERCRVVREHSQGPEMDIGSGEKVELWAAHGRPVGDRYLHSVRYDPGTDAREAITDLAMRALFGAGNHYGYLTEELVREPRVCMVAMVDGPVVPVGLANRRCQVNDVGLLAIRVPVRLMAGARVPVPKDLIARHLIAFDGHVAPRSRGDTGFVVDEGNAVFEFRIPVGERGAVAHRLVLHAPAEVEFAPPMSGSPGRAQRERGGRGRGRPGGQATVSAAPGQESAVTDIPTLEILAYNLRAGEWKLLSSGGAQSLNFPRPSEYMSSDGRVLLKLSAPSASASFEQLTVEAEVTSH